LRLLKASPDFTRGLDAAAIGEADIRNDHVGLGSDCLVDRFARSSTPMTTSPLLPRQALFIIDAKSASSSAYDGYVLKQIRG
jgi:hypothetical protein